MIHNMVDDDWIFFTNPKTIVSIHQFDDGNEQYQYYTNSWFVIGQWRGKVKLRNTVNPTIEIPSISEWKTIIIQSVT
jgi:hypothetical protein